MGDTSWPAKFQGCHASAKASPKAYPRDITLYITKELDRRAMLGPFDQPPFTPWCQVNPLLTHVHSKKDSHNRRDLPWSLPPAASINGGMPKDTYIGVYKINVPPFCPIFGQHHMLSR